MLDGITPAQMMPEGMSHAAPVAMVVLHIVAAALTTLMLTKGEAALWALAAWLRPQFRLLEAVFLRPLRTIPVRDPGFVPLRTGSLRLPTLRGPPEAASAVV